MQNTDTFNYGDPRLPMYTNIPFYIGILKDKCYGIFHHNSFPGTVNFGAGNVRFMSVSHEGGDADYFFFHDDDPSGIITAYTSVTGRTPLPPLWSLGFHQSRCSYYNESQVMDIAEDFRRKGIPLDCIVLDADYLVDYKPFVRSHRIAFGSGNEPWSYGEIPEGIAKTYIGLRYRMLPYIYSQFERSTRDGMPLSRSLCVDHPYDSKVYDKRYQYEYLFGPSVLVAPAIPGEPVTPIYLPEGEWHEIYSGEILEGGRELSSRYPDCQLPLFVKGSSIIPMQSLTAAFSTLWRTSEATTRKGF